MNWKAVLFVGLVGYGAHHAWETRAVTHGAGEIAPNIPQQHNLANADAQNINGYQLTPLAKFSIEARVLASKSYSFGREATLSPVDLALGWGPMSDETVLNKIDISQSNRFYFWHVDAFPIPREEIETHSANMHMIPADGNIEQTLKSVRVGQVINIEGYLIEAKSADGWRWKSSLTRNDTGGGACEVMLVKSIYVH
ncbi:MAG: hypothetical protein ACXWTR_01480 [Methylotenera sp.]